MADKRMFSNTIIDSDMFLDMPISAQVLYFHLCMRADDDGFVNNPKRIMRTVNASDDDLKILIAKQFVLVFDTGVIVITHWRIHNYIKNDRYHTTVCQEEKAQLVIKENKEYAFDGQPCIPPVSKLDTNCIHSVSALDTQNRLDKNRLDKNRLDKNNILSDSRLDEIKDIISYLNQTAGTSFRYQSEKTQKLIQARFNEGFTIDDFYRVIDNKCNEWLDTNYAKYLRPETLFSNKFEGYLNQKPDEGAFGWMNIEI